MLTIVFFSLSTIVCIEAAVYDAGKGAADSTQAHWSVVFATLVLTLAAILC